MIARLPLRGSTPHPTLQQLIDRHGFRAVMLALIGLTIRKRRLRRRRRRGFSTDRLSAHMRRDIGLPPHHHEPLRYWDHF